MLKAGGVDDLQIKIALYGNVYKKTTIADLSPIYRYKDISLSTLICPISFFFFAV
jgi:hypothetical protein